MHPSMHHPSVRTLVRSLYHLFICQYFFIFYEEEGIEKKKTLQFLLFKIGDRLIQICNLTISLHEAFTKTELYD